ncbi:MAG: hypothetical protein Q8P90_00775 [bacterium]|nr:hypothetical protein [bacterium]
MSGQAISSLGVSPAEYGVSLQPNGNTQGSVSLTRSNADKDQVFDVIFNFDDAPALSFTGPEQVTLHQGESKGEYQYSMQATNAPYGSNVGYIEFVLIDDNNDADSKDDAEKALIKQNIGVGHKVVINITDDVTAQKSATYIESPNDISFTDFTTTKKKYFKGEKVEVLFNVKNDSDQAIEDISYVLTISDVNNSITIHNGSIGRIGPYSEFKETNSFEITDAGKYTVKLEYYQTESLINFSIINRQSIFYVFIEIILVGAILSLIYFFGKDKKIQLWIKNKGVLITIIIVICIVIILILGATISYFSIPEIKVSGDENTMYANNDGIVLVQDYDDLGVIKNSFIRLMDGKTDFLSGYWDFFVVADNHFYAIPDGKNEHQDFFYNIYGEAIYQYKLSNLPSGIDEIIENSSFTYMLLVGEDYHCVSAIDEYNGLNCTYLENIIKGYSIVYAGWAEDSDQYINIIAEQDSQQSTFMYDAWNNTYLPIDEIEKIERDNYEIAEDIINKDDVSLVFQNKIALFQDGKKMYRSPSGARFIHVKDETYVMLVENAEQTELFLFDAQTGHSGQVMTLSSKAKLFYLEKGNLITDPVI